MELHHGGGVGLATNFQNSDHRLAHHNVPLHSWLLGRGHILVMLESWLDETGRYVLRGCMGLELKANVCTLRAAHETDA